MTPSQPRLRHNDYAPLAVPAIGEWAPSLRVSVVIPAYQDQEKLDLTLAGLAAQTYPSELIEVIVVDDASEPTLRIPPVGPKNLRMVTPPADGWGSAHAVNAGVAVASGDVILRLDADLIVAREHVEAHLRWHHTARYLVVLGRVVFAPYVPGVLRPDQVVDQVARSAVATVFAGEAEQRASWVEKVYAATNNLREGGSRAFRAANGATVSFPRWLFDAAGGMDRAMPRGSDTELGYRMAQVGAVFVPESQAMSWHLGPSEIQSDRESGLRTRAPFLRDRVPLLRDLRRTPGFTYGVPVMDVVLAAADRSFEDIQAVTLAVLNGTLDDVRVTLVAPWDDVRTPGRSALRPPLRDLLLCYEAFRSNPRVRFVTTEPESVFPAPFVLRCPAGPVPTPDAVRRLVDEMEKRQLGLLLLPFPRDRMLPIARVERTAAFARARTLAVDQEDLEDVVHDMFGVYWINGAEWAFTDLTAAATPEHRTSDAEKWKRLADERKTLVEKLQAEAARWRREAQVPIAARIRRGLRRRVVRALRMGRRP